MEGGELKMNTNTQTTNAESNNEGEMVTDLVCGMTISKEEAKFSSELNDTTYYFCSPGCKTQFDNDPKKYLV